MGSSKEEDKEEMNKHVIIAHYNEDLNWVKHLNVPYTVLSKEALKLNVGHESWTYVYFIVQNYHSLPDKMLFLHGHETSFHQTYPSWYIANNLNWNKFDYINVNDHAFWENGDMQCIWEGDYEDCENNYRRSYDLWLKNNWQDIFNNELELPKSLWFLGFGQFMVSKHLVLRHSIEFYKRILRWLETTDLDKRLYVGDPDKFKHSYASARVFEYLWHYIFTGNPVEHLEHYLL